MFTQTAAFYDAIYAARGKDYRAESEAVVAYLRATVPDAVTLLDVGCGTGLHLAEFARAGFAVRGIDVDLKMVALARSRLPDVRVDPGDMTTLALEGETFDAIVSLFGSTGYARVPSRLDAAIARIATHLKPGGVLVVEAFLDAATYRPGRVDAVFVDDEDLKIARMSLSKQMGKIAILDFHYMVATLRGVERLFERHELGLFDESAYRTAFEAAGLTFERIDLGPAFVRAVYAGRAPL